MKRRHVIGRNFFHKKRKKKQSIEKKERWKEKMKKEKICLQISY